MVYLKSQRTHRPAYSPPQCSSLSLSLSSVAWSVVGLMVGLELMSHAQPTPTTDNSCLLLLGLGLGRFRFGLGFSRGRGLLLRGLPLRRLLLLLLQLLGALDRLASSSSFREQRTLPSARARSNTG